MSATGLLTATVVVEALLLLMSSYHVQGRSSNGSCTETCEKYRIVDVPYTLSCGDITDETERSDCQENCQSCKDICNDGMVEKIYNCPDINGKMEVTSEGEGLGPTKLGSEDGDETTVPTSGFKGRSRTATVETVEERRLSGEDPEREPGATMGEVLIWVALIFVLLIVIVGGVIMFCVLCGPRRRNRNRREPEAESGMSEGQHVTSSGSDESMPYYPVIPPETQVVLRPSDQY